MPVQTAPPGTEVTPHVADDREVGLDATPDVPYDVVLWNDPVNLMPIVVRVLQKVFGYGREKAVRLMMIAHHEGKASVWTGPRDRAIAYALQLGTHGLSSTVARAT